jgi:outer membrane protein assembly factor BamB
MRNSNPKRQPLGVGRTGWIVGAIAIGWMLMVSDTKAADGLNIAAHDGPLYNWPQWRGPLGTGVAPHADPPLSWDGETGENIRWKTPIPGRGHSAPIVWGDRVFLTTAIPYGEALPPRFSTAPGTHDGVPVTHHHKFVVLAVNRSDGQICWQRTVRQALPHEGGHHTASLASNSPVTDGKNLFAFFGSYGLYCLDFDGELRWKQDLGQMQTLHGHGEGSSPVVYGDRLFVNWDHEGGSFVAAFDTGSGRELWRVERDEVTSWATPIVTEVDGRTQLIVSGTDRIRGYDLATGETIWQCGGLSTNVVASPVAGDGMVFAGSSYDKRALLAIDLVGATGDVTDTDHVAWSRSRGTPYVPSPLLYDDALYFLAHYQGILTRVHARTGEDQPGATRLEAIGDVYASPIGAAGRVYVTDLEGMTCVLQHGSVARVLAVNRLGEAVSASAAAVGRDLLLRGKEHLYCIAATE